LLLALLALLTGGAVLIARQGNSPGGPAPSETALEVELRVTVKSSPDAEQVLGIEEADAVPVRAGGWMNLEIHFNQPMFAYLVWLDSQGRATPLYPWNNDATEVTDVNQPPPLRRASQAVLSPMTLGGGWKFGQREGIETVLLLARRTPLDNGVRLGDLLGKPPTSKIRLPSEVSVLGLDPGKDSVSTLLSLNRGSEEEAQAADEPWRALLVRLRDHFELIRAVRFVHEGK
jgi:hypothetical protein